MAHKDPEGTIERDAEGRLFVKVIDPKQEESVKEEVKTDEKADNVKPKKKGKK